MNWKRNRHLRANGTSTYHGWKYALLGMSVTLISTASAMRAAQQSSAAQTVGPAAELSVQDIYQRAKRWHDSIKSVRIEYEWALREVTKNPESIAVTGRWHVFFAFDLSKDRRRSDHRRLETFKPELGGPLENLYLFDGDKAAEVAFGRQPSDSQPTMKTVTITNANGKSSQLDIDPYCDAAIKIPLSDYLRARYDHLPWYPHCIRDPSIKGFHCRVLARQEAVDGAWCHVVEFPDAMKLWVDPKLDCACRKVENFEPRLKKWVLVNRAIASEFEEYASGVWLPRRYHNQSFLNMPGRPDLDGKVWIDSDMKVEQLSINNVEDMDFKLQVAPGTMIWDRVHNRLFRLPGNTDDIMREVESRAKPLVKSSLGFWRYSAIIATSAVIAALICLLVVRRVRQHHATG